MRRQVALNRAADDALKVLGIQIKTGRVTRGWTVTDLAHRIDVDPRTLTAIESGSAKVSIGNVFNAALTVGVNLFGLEGNDLALARHRGEDTLALLPERVRTPPTRDNDDDFAF